MRILISIFLLVSVLLFAGCDGANTPAELKNLVPVTITVTDGSQPLEGVSVALNCKSETTGFFVCNGITDATGVTKIQTTRSSHTRKGAPVGTYSVVLVKSVEIPEELQPREEDQNNPVAAAAKQTKRDAFLKENQAIPLALTQATSPIELTVAEKSGATAEIDIAKYR